MPTTVNPSLHSSRRARAWALGFIVAAGLLITGWLFREARQYELDRFERRFDNDASIRARLIEYRLGDCLLVSEALVQLFQASELVTPSEFGAFTRPLLARTGDISAIAWVPAVPRDGRAAFEEQGPKAPGPALRIFERAPGGNAVPAGERAVHYPLYHVQSSDDGYRRDVGFDLGSVAVVLAGLEKARATGRPVACSRTDVMANGRQAMAVIVPSGGTPVAAAGRARVSSEPPGGFAVAILHEDALLRMLTRSTGPAGMDLALLDVSGPGEAVPVVRRLSRLPAGESWCSVFFPAIPQYTWEFGFADRRLRIAIAPGAAYLQRNYPIAFWLFLPTGVLLTALLGHYLSSVLSQRERLAQQVEERTAELRASEEKYRQVVENANEAIFVAQDGMFVFVNAKCGEVLGLPHEGLVGTRFDRFVHPDDRDDVLARYARRLSGEDLAPTYAFRILNKAGRILWVENSAVAMEWAGGRATLNFLTDITARLKAEEQKAVLESRLAQAQKMDAIGQLAGGVAHDFNNMLSVILGSAEMALETVELSDPVRRLLEDIQNAGRRSADLTRQLLAFARKQTISPRVLDLNDTVAGMLKMLGRLIGEDVELTWRPGHDLWNVRIDPSQVDQVLANLAVNARDAIGGTGKIVLETSNCVCDEVYCAARPEFVPGEYVMLAVSDDGCGMDRQTLASIFEPFFTTKKEGQGTGLGLSTVYGIVRQNNGFVYVYSEPGTGTTFKIYLPRHTAGGAGAAPDRADAQLPRGSETILAVEDEAAVLGLTKGMLERLGYTVLAVSQADHAILLAREYEGPIDLLLTDVVMPDMNGRELSEFARTIRPALKCLYMSGYTADVIARQGILEEGVHLVPKPFSLKDLAVKVREALDEPARPS